jgi:cell division protein ZapA (FtsZ GTPase activity inhibitor)
MSKLSINVVIAGRTYPLTITDGEQEKVQKAADAINKMVTVLQDNYAVKDKQDLLAMAALQLASKSQNAPAAQVVETVAAPDFSEIEMKLASLLKLVEDTK